jgi:hypothetical protein
MAKSLVTLGAAAALGTATLTTSSPATAQPWLAPVIVGSFLTGAFVGGSSSFTLPANPTVVIVTPQY